MVEPVEAPLEKLHPTETAILERRSSASTARFLALPGMGLRAEQDAPRRHEKATPETPGPSRTERSSPTTRSRDNPSEVAAPEKKAR